MLVDKLKTNWVHFAAIAIFFLTTLIVFYPSYQGQILQQGDITHWQGMSKESKTFTEKTGEQSLWIGSMFGGMPNYYIDFKQRPDPIDYIGKVFRLGFGKEVGKVLSGMLAFYLLLLLLKVNPWLAIIGAITFAYSTNNLVLLNAGHNTKVATLMISPLIIAGVLLAYKKDKLLGTLVFILAMSLNLKASHPQMTYYLGIVLLIYTIFQFVGAIKNKGLSDFLKTSGFLVVGLLLAIGTTANKTLPIYEYSKDTIRGAPILKNSKSNDSSSKVEGLAWDYAMGWSNGIEDLIPSFIPLAVGGSSTERVSKDSQFAKEIRKRGGSSKNLSAPLYWGSLPFTSGPIYFGAVIFFLFFLAAFTLEGNIKWWILTAVLLTFLLSMGKNFEGLNRFFFNYFPYFNKFRTPNSVLSVTAIIIPLMAILGLQDIFTRKNLPNKKLLFPGLGFIVFTLLIGLLGPGIFDMTSASDLQLEQYGIKNDILIADRAALLRSSAIKAALMMAITLGALWAYSNDKLKMVPTLVIIGLLAIGDLFAVNNRYVSSANYQSERKAKTYYTPRAVDLQLLKDKDPNYRVIDNTVNFMKSSFASYFHKSLGGYHAAKLQRYQDIVDYHISKNNMNVFNMLNTKYFITGQQGAEEARLNSAALGNSWFVNSVRFVPTADAEIEALTDFDPLGEAIVHEEFKSVLTGTSFEKNGTIKLLSYAPNKLVYSSNTTSKQLAVFSEVWYGPNKGWKAYINGQAVDHIRVNYILRALEIPAGQNEINFEFQPDSNKNGRLISLICNVLFLLAAGFYLRNWWKQNKTTL